MNSLNSFSEFILLKEEMVFDTLLTWLLSSIAFTAYWIISRVTVLENTHQIGGRDI